MAEVRPSPKPEFGATLVKNTKQGLADKSHMYVCTEESVYFDMMKFSYYSVDKSVSDFHFTGDWTVLSFLAKTGSSFHDVIFCTIVHGVYLI